MKIGFVGLGIMGRPMALNLKNGGHDLLVPERASLTAEIRAAATVLADATAVAAGSDVIILMVPDTGDVEQALFGAGGVAAGLRKGSLVIDMSSISPVATKEFAKKINALGCDYVDAPVSGGAGAARGGTMTVMASGSAAAFEQAQPVLDAVAGKVWRLGDAAGIGSTIKMVNQLLAGVHIAVAAEAMALGIRAGADPQTLFEVISSSAGSSWMWQNRMPHVLAGDDTPLSAVNIFVKDLGIVLDQARALTFPLPMAASAHQLFLAAAAAGHGGRDDSFVIRFWENLAGISLPAKPAGE